MNVVLDTNVFISSFFGGNPRKIITRWQEGTVRLCLCPQIVEEYTEVLDRMGLAGQPEADEILSLFARGFYCAFSAAVPDISVVKDDPDDDKFFACAVELNALYIISGDRHVLQVKNYMGIKIVAPKEFLDLKPVLSGCFKQLNV